MKRIKHIIKAINQMIISKILTGTKNVLIKCPNKINMTDRTVNELYNDNIDR
jgi:hypothetical protein